jgi:hypothetical protein
MKKYIKKILREEMVSMIGLFEPNTNTIKQGSVTAITTLISKDNENGNKFWLFVVFNDFKDITEYSYSFMLTDKNDDAIINDYLTTRSEVAPYIPNDIKNKKQIFPIIKNMTRELLDSYLPQNIFRKTVEPVDGDSLIRYEEITNIMVDEYGYTLESKEETRDGRTIWYLSRGEVTDNNKEMNESYEIIHEYSLQEKMKTIINPILPLLKNYYFKPMFECKLPNINK